MRHRGVVDWQNLKHSLSGERQPIDHLLDANKITYTEILFCTD